MVSKLILVGLAGLLAACSTTPPDERSDSRDVFENTNRSIYAFNMAADTYLLEPVADGYRSTIPEGGQQAVNYHLRWASMPSTAINSTLQGKFENAGLATLNFLVNGLTLGFADLTQDHDTIEQEDFGQTLAVWGSDSGPYLMLPLFGPSNARDTAGKVVDIFTDPFSLVFGFVPAVVRTGTAIVDNRSETIEASESLEATSLDLYASVRTLHFQNREFQIRNGAPAPLDDLYRDLELQKDVSVRFPRARNN